MQRIHHHLSTTPINTGGSSSKSGDAGKRPKSQGRPPSSGDAPAPRQPQTPSTHAPRTPAPLIGSSSTPPAAPSTSPPPPTPAQIYRAEQKAEKTAAAAAKAQREEQAKNFNFYIQSLKKPKGPDRIRPTPTTPRPPHQEPSGPSSTRVPVFPSVPGPVVSPDLSDRITARNDQLERQRARQQQQLAGSTGTLKKASDRLKTFLRGPRAEDNP
jgi:hypothetical protein